MLTRKHFERVAAAIAELPCSESRYRMAVKMAGIFHESNSRFDHKRFYDAVAKAIPADAPSMRSEVREGGPGDFQSVLESGVWPLSETREEPSLELIGDRYAGDYPDPGCPLDEL